MKIDINQGILILSVKDSFILVGQEALPDCFLRANMSTWHKSMCGCRLSLIESRFFSKSQWHIRAGLIKQWKLSKLFNTGKLKCKLDAWFQEFASGQPATRQNISPLPPQVGKSSKPSREPVFQAPLKMTTSVDENHESEGGVVEPLQQPLQALRSEK